MSDEGIDLSRRQFFGRGVRGVAKAGIGVLEQSVSHKASAWIRPPFAQPELDFLLACTRCNACVEACPHQVVFTLSVSCGVTVVGTPALDLLNKGCHLCEDWPCVQVCEPKALLFPDMGIPEAETLDVQQSDQQSDVGAQNILPQMLSTPLAVVEIDVSDCLPYSGPECGACKGSCPVPDTLLWVDEKPVIDPHSCIGCAMCREACIVDPKAPRVTTIPRAEIEAE